MSQRLPNVTARQVVAALKRGGFRELRQKGGHLHLIHPATDAITTIPMHPGDLKRPLLKAILRQAGLSEDEFRELL